MVGLKQFSVSSAYAMKSLTLLACLCAGTAFAARNGGVYKLRGDQPEQIIKGLGFEIQSDSIGSGNSGMPDEVDAVPNRGAQPYTFYLEGIESKALVGHRYPITALDVVLG